MIVEVRDVIAGWLDGFGWTVHRFIPEDVDALPCIAVPRPRLRPSSVAKGLVSGEVVAVVVGSRINSDDAQDELDVLTDAVVARFGGIARSVALESPTVHSLVLNDVSPGQTLISGVSYPVYMLTIQATFTTC